MRKRGVFEFSYGDEVTSEGATVLRSFACGNLAFIIF